MTGMKKIVGAAALSVLGLAAVGMAGEGRGFGGREGWSHGGGGRHGFGMGLRELNLTDDQKSQLKQIHEQQKQAMQPLMEQHRQLRDQIEQSLSSGKPDATRIGQLEIQLFNLRGQFKAQHEKMQQAFVSVLTPEQKAQWEKLRAEREQRREERQQQRQQRDQNDDQERQ
jgi:Spy/CpxP family protein refolding chaperone